MTIVANRKWLVAGLVLNTVSKLALMTVRPSLDRLLGALTVLTLGLTACPGAIDNPAPFIAARAGDAGSPDAGVDAGTTPDAGPLVCPDIVAEIFSNPALCSAANCHASSAFQAGLDLQSANLVARLLAAPPSTTCGMQRWLDPDSPADSLLHAKLTDAPPCGSMMPLRGQLSVNDVQCVLQWVETVTGAPPDAGVAPDAGRPPPPSLQAEAASFQAPLGVQADPGAEGGEYLVVPIPGTATNEDPTAADTGHLTVTFEADSPVAHRVWLRARTPSIANDSVWLRMDQGRWIKWNAINLDLPGWHWQTMKDSDNGEGVLDFTLQAGQHTLEVRRREAGVEMDAFIITDDPAFDPNP